MGGNNINDVERSMMDKDNALWKNRKKEITKNF